MKNVPKHSRKKNISNMRGKCMPLCDATYHAIFLADFQHLLFPRWDINYPGKSPLHPFVCISFIDAKDFHFLHKKDCILAASHLLIIELAFMLVKFRRNSWIHQAMLQCVTAFINGNMLLWSCLLLLLVQESWMLRGFCSSLKTNKFFLCPAWFFCYLFWIISGFPFGFWGMLI